MLLKDRIAIVTGAASRRGIGKAAARRFVEEGARVAIFDLDAAAAAGRRRRPRSGQYRARLRCARSRAMQGGGGAR